MAVLASKHQKRNLKEPFKKQLLQKAHKKQVPMMSHHNPTLISITNICIIEKSLVQIMHSTTTYKVD